MPAQAVHTSRHKHAAEASASEAASHHEQEQQSPPGLPLYLAPVIERLAEAPGLLQAKLEVGPPGDPFEREADAAAERIIAGAQAKGGCSCGGSGGCSCGSGPVAVQRVAEQATAPSRAAAPASVHEALAGSGEPLPQPIRDAFEPGFGYDFGNVRVHTGAQAAASAAAVHALAYTVGEDIVFGSGRYDPVSTAGRRLLAHELTHVVQQRGRPGNVLQRAVLTIGSTQVQVDYGNLLGIADADLVSAIESRFVSFTGAADASAIHASLTALTITQQRWVLHSVDLLQDNTSSPLHNRLNRVSAVQRLIAHAPSAAHRHIGGPLGPAQEEALRVSGWFEVGLAASLTAPTAADRASINAILNPPPAGGAGAALDVTAFHSRMKPAVRHLINQLDPANWPTTGTESLASLKAIADRLMTEARSFFSPWADRSRTTVFGLNPPFHISANIFSVTTLTPDADQRKGYLRNRATIVGRNSTSSSLFSDKDIFHDVNFDGTRPADRVEFEKLVTDLEGETAVRAAVNRLIQHTGRQSGSGASTTIGLSTEYNSAVRTECEARWRMIETICHEIMHALAHPDFEAQFANVGFGQVLLEGVPEVLATQMFNQRVKPKAASDTAFKSLMEAGLASAPCAAPPNATIGYGAAGAGAESIRTKASVGDDKLRAAFFLGQVHLLGL